MHVPVRHADQSCGNSGTGDLNHVRVGPGRTRLCLHLIRDLLPLRHVHQQLPDHGVDIRAFVEDRPATQLDIAYDLLLRTRLVGGKPDINGNPYVGFDPEGAGSGATKADLFLDRGNGRDLHVLESLSLAQPAEDLRDDEGADLVVKGPTHSDVLPEHCEPFGHGHHVSRLDPLLCVLLVPHPDVHPQFVRLGHLLPLFRGHQVNRLLADDTENPLLLRVHVYPSTRHQGEVDASHGLDVEKPFVRHVLNQEADLVAVSGQHHPEGCATVQSPDHIAVNVGLHILGEGPHTLSNNFLYLCLETGRARGIDEVLEKPELYLLHLTSP